MNCKHDRLRCTNNQFYCMDCGSMVLNPYEAKKPVGEQPEGQEEKPVETQKTGRKRKAAKADK